VTSSWFFLSTLDLVGVQEVRWDKRGAL